MKDFLKREIVFVIAFTAALVSAFFNPPSVEWIKAVDFRTLGMLFSLMGVSEGLKSSGLFDQAAGKLMKSSGDMRRLSAMLTAIVFVSSMFFTNDVALLMFVPFSMMLMDREGADEGYVIRLVVLETISANLGSMTTPVGNPQNLYICSFFDVDASGFFSAILPYSVLSAVLIVLCFRLLLWKNRPVEEETRDVRKMDRDRTIVYLIFLLVAMLSVFHVIDWKILFVVELAFLIAFDKTILKRIDYILLLTFVAFFIFSENLRSMEAVRAFISGPMKEHPVAVSAIVSQVRSNVPAAILLSPFADGFRGVLVGTDIGGLGTPIASLASLISLKFYFSRSTGRKGRYLAVFMLLNIVFLAILGLLASVLR